jgi:catechol 2,3-dioxygenase-like lactoylglutathione lyase family enzyme
MILGVHHPALAVPSMEAGLDFYCGKLGFEVTMTADIPSGIAPMNTAFGIEDAGCKVRMLKKGNSFLELFEFNSQEEGESGRPVNKSGITHFALITDDPEADYEVLKAAGVEFNTPLFGGAPSRFAYGRDPFGNVIELLEHEPGGASAVTI